METTTTRLGPRKAGGYSTYHLKAKKDAKRQEAEARQREHNSLTLSEKIEKAKSRRGESKKELARLAAQVPKAEWDKAMKVSEKTAIAIAPETPTKEVKTTKTKKVAKAKPSAPKKSSKKVAKA